MRRRLVHRATLIAMAMWFAAPVSAAPAARRAPSWTRGQADSLAVAPPSPARDRTLAEWAKRATTGDLVWLLRRTPDELGGSELTLLDAALSSLSPGRESLRQRLLARRALATARAGARAARKGDSPLPDLAPLRPYASVFRVALLLPDRGEYAGHARSVRAAVAAGLAWGRAADAPPIALDTLGTGDSEPALVAAALERVAGRSEIVVGELLSVATLSLATAARLTGLTLVSPTATNERIGSVSARVFQVGPGVETRARALADVVLGRTPHTVAIAGSAAGVRGAFAAAFAHEVEARGGRVVRREVAPSGGAGMTPLATSLEASGADVLFWDGASRDAEALMRALAGEGATLHVCGGLELAPDGVRPSARTLFEGVTYVDDDWQLSGAVGVRLDSLASASGAKPGSLWTRGFLAGRRVAAAVDAGALTAVEVAEQLRNADASLAASGFMDVSLDGATLPVFVVRGGRAVNARGAQAP